MKLIVIIGPTAVGKTKLSIKIAKEIGGEIIGADSRQVYRYMDIGTAKPLPHEREVPYHLIDVIYPDEEFSLAIFKKLFYEKLGEIKGRGKIPFLVGGTGQYIWAVLEGWKIPPVPPNKELRRELEEKAKREGVESIFRELLKLDPEAEKIIDPRNLRRIIRAIEVSKALGIPFTKARTKEKPGFKPLIIGLKADRPSLYRRIEERVDRMMEMGFLEEVEGLLRMGYSPELPSMNTFGYRELSLYIEGKLSLDEALRITKRRTKEFARRQFSWFRLDDRRIKWFDIREEGYEDRVRRLIYEFCEDAGYGE